MERHFAVSSFAILGLKQIANVWNESASWSYFKSWMERFIDKIVGELDPEAALQRPLLTWRRGQGGGSQHGFVQLLGVEGSVPDSELRPREHILTKRHDDNNNTH